MPRARRPHRRARRDVDTPHVTVDKSRTYCGYDGPDAASIRRAAERIGLPTDVDIRMSMLDPYCYR
jgi:hypothetical protein